MKDTGYNKDVDVLIVDDEIDICYLLAGILRKKNLHSSFVNTLKDAEAMLNSIKPSILFLDNNLPDGTGVNAVDGIKQRNPNIKIIIITADDTISNKEKAIKAGTDFFLGKPFSSDNINRIVDSLEDEKVSNRVSDTQIVE